MPNTFSIIAALEKNNGIGKNNALPWHLPPDLKHFRELTTLVNHSSNQNAVICGKNTWFSIPQKFRPLPNRLNIIISSTLSSVDLPPKVLLFQSLDEALINLKFYPNLEKIFIIGGAKLYKVAINHQNCSNLYLTKIFNSYPCDTFFPEIPSHFKKQNSSPINQYENVNFQFIYYKNKNI